MLKFNNHQIELVKNGSWVKIIVDGALVATVISIDATEKAIKKLVGGQK